MRFLEIGANCGYALHTFKKFNTKWDCIGIDLSPEDIEIANRMYGQEATFLREDAMDYLSNNTGFDIIYTRAVLEHVEKEKIFDFLYAIKNAMNKNAIAIIEVPNMDWIHASHERYMDFTHEVGFTKESLLQVLKNVFDSVEVEYSYNNAIYGNGIKMRLARFLMSFIYLNAEPIFEKDAFYSRCIIGVVKD